MDIGLNAKAAVKKRATKKLIRSNVGEGVLETIATIEVSLAQLVAEQHALLGLDEIDADSLPEKEQRVEQLREAALASVDGRFPEWWVRNCSGLTNPDRAARFADADEWRAIKERWANSYDREASVDELANAHTKTLHDVDAETFRRTVVEWPEGRTTQEFHSLATANFDAIHDALERANEDLRNRDLGEASQDDVRQAIREIETDADELAEEIAPENQEDLEGET